MSGLMSSVCAASGDICNLAFDVTAAKYISAIITERGVLPSPYVESLRGMELAAK